MNKIQGSAELLNSMQITADTAGMDKASKDIMKNKEVLAVILKGVVREYENYNYEEIMNFIEGDSITDDEEVTAGRNTSRIIGDDKEYTALGEKTASFDTKFRSLNPELSSEELMIYLHIDIEPQKKYNPGYPIEKRGIYYLARELSSQLSVVTEETNYGHLEKCYSIFICRDDIPREEKFSISFYEMSNTKNYGNCVPKKEKYDLLTLVVIRLGDSVYNGVREDEGYDVLRFLHTIMYPHKEDFLKTVKEYIDFSHNEILWKEMDKMSGLGMSILEEGRTEGRIEGRDMINQLILCLIHDGRNEDIEKAVSNPEYQNKLIRHYGLDQEAEKMNSDE